MMLNNKYTLLATLLLLSACQSTPTKPQTVTTCPEPRPEICTMNIETVCGLFADGKSKTFSNACAACSDETVVGFNKDQCI